MRRWVLVALPLLVACGLAVPGCGQASPASEDADESGGGRAGGAGRNDAGGHSGEPVNAGRGGDVTTAGQANVSESIALDELLEPFVDAVCVNWARCRPLNEYHEMPGGCVEAYRRLAEDEIETLRRGVQSARLRYDATQMGACLAAYRSAPCGMIFTVLPDCIAAFDGTVLTGGACDHNLDCAGPARCEGCPGQCTRGAATGAACATGRDCESGSCQGDACAPLAQLGDPCGVLDETSLLCAFGLKCLGEDQGTLGVCSPYRFESVGSACDPSGGVLCEAGAACVRVLESGTDQCVPEAATGEPCSIGSQNACAPGDYCRSEHNDQAMGDLADSCVPLATPGEPCDHHEACGADAFCRTEDTLLRAAPPLGVCVLLGTFGEPCTADSDCLFSECSQGVCSNPTSCDSFDPELPKVPHCPTDAPDGALLHGFDEPDSTEPWTVFDLPEEEQWSSISHSADEGHSCPGALRLEITEPDFGAYVSLSARIGTASLPDLDWTRRTKLHAWIKVADPGVAELAYLGKVSVSASGSTGTGGLVVEAAEDLYLLEDWNWHELVVPLDRFDLAHMDNYGLTVTLEEQSAGGPLPQSTTIYLDDLWLE